MTTVGDLAQPDFFETAVDTMDIGVAICDSGGEIQYVNSSYARLLETTRSELVGTQIGELRTTVLDEQFEGDRHSFPDRKADSVDTEYSFDGVVVPVTEMTTQRIVDGTEYLFKQISERTEQQERERMLKQQNARLQSQCEQLETQKEQFESFAQVVSHDLRNPLSIAQGYLDTVREESADESLDKVSDALARMETLIDDLLSLAAEGESVGEIEAVSLEGLADSAWANTRTFGAALTVDEYEIYADPIRTQQLLENLFRNAIEHAGPDIDVYVGGLSKISMSTRVGRQPELATGFYVSDDGPGVDPSDRETVFSESYSTSENGTGLGLATVKKIATAHGWQTRCTESRDGGARFEFLGTAQQPDP